MKRLLFLLFVSVIIFASGCLNEVVKPNIELNPKVQKIISDNYVSNMRCTSEDIKLILDYAKAYGIQNPYIPTKGVATDYIVEIRKEDDALAIIYPHFSIRESSKEIPPINKVEQEKSVKLAVSDGKWRKVEGNAPQLYLKLGNVYITIDSAKYLDEKEYETIAESLVQIKK
ncbi:MAG: hypothetical protein PWR06_2516 [Thermoanaerobacteraceae bacterium]|nr:hypothetical protein [Thermoanaerobacteraceae bacterium]MDN5313625.1 hypothetical protein [Thermoanaerobacteraceae bacterium]RKL61295.1 hypothetical protein DXT63_17460 [Thermoanaerobacteraceae bacterium SP2]